MKYFKKIIGTIKNEGIMALADKLILKIKYWYVRYFFEDQAEINRWKELHNKYRGRRVFLIGNGPSLNKMPLYLLKDDYTMCFNRFYIMHERLNWTADFYLTVDDLVLDDLVKEIDDMSGNFDYLFFPDIHVKGGNFKQRIKPNHKIYWIRHILGQGFSKELPCVNPGGSVIYEGMQILSYLGFDEIYLIGVDMNFQIHKTAKMIREKGTDIVSLKDDDPNHFDPRYFGTNRKYHQPEEYVIKKIMNSLDYIGENAKRYDVNIMNAGYESKVESFPKTNFEALFSYSPGDKYKLFLECMVKNSKFTSLEEFEKNGTFIPDERGWNSELVHFYVNEEDGIKLINKAIFTHIPLGPYNGRYYFIRRSITGKSDCPAICE
ncbi:MAG: DUF115 domain-containing protein [Deltaproteobacteria bacterium]